MYDTLTAADTYRTRMSSFEALRELRRVAGTQLDAGYVEVLAGLLSGEGVEYRHADAADFDSELDMERRIKQARAGRVGAIGPRMASLACRVWGLRPVGALCGSARRIDGRLPQPPGSNCRLVPASASADQPLLVSAAAAPERRCWSVSRNCSICSTLNRR